MSNEPLTRKEVEAWPALGPMSIKAQRVLALLDERDELRTAQAAWLASPEAAKRLEGYRELGAKCAALEAERDEARATAELHAVALAAAEAREMALRAALTKLIESGCPIHDYRPDPDAEQTNANCCGCIADAALAAPADTSALRAHDAKVLADHDACLIGFLKGENGSGVASEIHEALRDFGVRIVEAERTRKDWKTAEDVVAAVLKGTP